MLLKKPDPLRFSCYLLYYGSFDLYYNFLQIYFLFSPHIVYDNGKEAEKIRKEPQKTVDNLQKAKTKLEAQVKKYQEEAESSKAVIKDLEKKLSAKNKSLESMTLSCQNNQAALRSIKEENDSMEKKITVLECTLDRKNER